MVRRRTHWQYDGSRSCHGYVQHAEHGRSSLSDPSHGQNGYPKPTPLAPKSSVESKDAVGDHCAVAVRFSADEEIGEDAVPIHGERRDMFAMLANLPDLRDVNIADYSVKMGVSRFTKEATLEPYMDFIKNQTSKPVVTVGRFISPDPMVSQIKRGITDLIGAARPSIADPFLLKKIE